MSPDGSTKPPPEEKLLRLIRGKASRREGATATASSGAGQILPLSGLRGARAAREFGWPRLAALGLGAVLVVEATVLIAQALRPLPVIPVPTIEASVPTEPAEPTAMPQEVPSLAASVARPLFSSPAEVAATAPATSTAPAKSSPSSTARLLASRLNLMGIISGNPAQAIIEDAETKKTYFVTVGQTVVEGAVLDQVLDNRVILDLSGEKIELTL